MPQTSRKLECLHRWMDSYPDRLRVAMAWMLWKCLTDRKGGKAVESKKWSLKCDLTLYYLFFMNNFHTRALNSAAYKSSGINQADNYVAGRKLIKVKNKINNPVYSNFFANTDEALHYNHDLKFPSSLHQLLGKTLYIWQQGNIWYILRDHLILVQTEASIRSMMGIRIWVYGCKESEFNKDQIVMARQLG